MQPCHQTLRSLSRRHERDVSWREQKDEPVEVWRASSSLMASQRGEREKMLWAGSFKAALWSCWSGGNASVWSGFSPAAAAEQHTSLLLLLLLLLVYIFLSHISPSWPFTPFSPHPSLSRGEEHLPHVTFLRGRKRKKERKTIKERLFNLVCSCSSNVRNTVEWLSQSATNVE